jgi:hypothetical protein
VLAPGKYYALATPFDVNKSPESIAKLWLARSRAEEISLGPSGSASVTLTPRPIE